MAAGGGLGSSWFLRFPHQPSTIARDHCIHSRFEGLLLCLSSNRRQKENGRAVSHVP